jgi:hypothetical protein
MIESSQIVSSAVGLVPLQADLGADGAAHRGLGRVTTHLEIIGFKKIVLFNKKNSLENI